MSSLGSGKKLPGQGLGVQTYVVEEQGRWVVYLDVAMKTSAADAALDAAPPQSDGDFHVVRRRINDYSSEAEAKVAARFISLGAGRELRKPPSGF